MITRRALLHAALVAAVGSPATIPGSRVAGAEEPENLAALLVPIRSRHGMPALAAAYLSGSDLKAIGAAGSRRGGVNDPVDTTDRFHIGSCTKSMTATLMARLVDEIGADPQPGQLEPVQEVGQPRVAPDHLHDVPRGVDPLLGRDRPEEHRVAEGLDHAAPAPRDHLVGAGLEDLDEVADLVVVEPVGELAEADQVGEADGRLHVLVLDGLALQAAGARHRRRLGPVQY